MKVKVTCEKCGIVEEEDLHVLPLGWERIWGDDYCPVCLAPLYEALSKAMLVTDLQETILGLLEEAGISSEINDKIMALLMVGELELLNREDAKAIDALISDLEAAKRLAEQELQIDTFEDMGIPEPTCVACGEVESKCECNQFDTERK